MALDEDGATRRKLLARLQGEISKRGTIDLLRHGIKHGAHDLQLFYGAPSAPNPRAQARFGQNRFTVVRQLRHSRDEAQRALDIGPFINGLPVFTFELKNSLTKQTVDDAVEQYRRDRNPREKLFELITKTIPARVAADSAFRNARQNSDDANARIEHDKVLARIVTGMVKDDAELFKQFMDNEGFKRWMTDRVFELACEQAAVQ